MTTPLCPICGDSLVQVYMHKDDLSEQVIIPVGTTMPLLPGYKRFWICDVHFLKGVAIEVNKRRRTLPHNEQHADSFLWVNEDGCIVLTCGDDYYSGTLSREDSLELVARCPSRHQQCVEELLKEGFREDFDELLETLDRAKEARAKSQEQTSSVLLLDEISRTEGKR